jgi:hypothetical protein
MAEFGRLALTVAGSFFGPWGTLAGGFLGSLLFPVEGPKGPRLNELNIQHSTVGSPIPIVYGTAKLAGNVIWSGGLVETEHEGGGGKGGPSGPTTYSYACDVAIGICEGPIAGVRRIWFDADLVYDASSDEDMAARWEGAEFDDMSGFIDEVRALSSQLDFDLYLGTEDQLPDPTIESHVGVGETPAYRGLAYIVFPNLQLERYGNRLPQVRLEVFTLGTVEECALYTAGHLEPWQYMYNAGTFDPRNPDNQHLYAECVTGLAFAHDAYATAMADMNATLGGGEGSYVCSEQPQGVDSTYIRGWANSSTPNQLQPCDADNPSAPSLSTDRIQVTMNLNTIRFNPNSCDVNTSSDGYSCQGLWVEFGDTGIYRYFTGGQFSGFWVVTDAGVYPTDAGVPPADWDNRGNCTPPAHGTVTKWAAFDQQLCVMRWWAPPDTSLYTWTRVTSGTFKSLRPYEDTGGTGGTVTAYPLDPTLRSDHPSYDDQTYWESAYAAAVAANDSLTLIDPNRIPEGWVYGVDYPTARAAHPTNFDSNAIWQAQCSSVTTDCIPMADIVSDICARAGLRTDTATQIDTSDLSTCVEGYIIGRQMSAREALGPLRMFGLWDAVESGELLKFIERGHAIAASLTTDDLGAHEAGAQPPTAVEVARTQEKDLPRRLRLHFPNLNFDHEVSEQSASRITTEAIDELDVELAISMAPVTAKQLAEIMLYEAYVSRNRYRFSLDHDFLYLEPTDCIEIPVDGQTERVRIVAVEYAIGGVLRVDAVRDDDGAYESTAIATPGQPSGGVPGSSGGGPICDSEVVLLDIPCLTGTPPTGEAWIYGAVYGTCPDFWNCAALYRSDDGGDTYVQVARTDAETTVGRIIDITGPATDPTLPGDSPPYDTTNTITVSLFEGTLGSVSDESIAAGLNLAAIGAPGRWVIIQFKTAVLDTTNVWVLSDLIWGVNGTAHLLGTTGINDTFVLLSDPALLRIPVPASTIGIEKHYKIVTCGQSIDAVNEFSFITWGLCYQRTCPSTVLSATTTTPPSGAIDGDAYLLPNDTSLTDAWANHGGEVAFWSDETQSWQFCTPVPGSIVHIVGDSSDAVPGEDVISAGGGNYTPAPWVVSPLTTKGDLYTYSTEDTRLPVGSNYDTVIADSATTTGLAWGVPAIPSNAQSGNYTIQASDRGRGIEHVSGAGSGDTYTIPANGTLALEVGFTFSVFNMATDSVTVAITTDTLYKAGAGTTGSVTVAQYGAATFRKVASTAWLWWGVGATP